MATVDTSTNAQATAFNGQRKQDATPDGVQWVVFADGTNLEFHYSADGGQTWAPASAGATVAAATKPDLFIDSSGRAHLVYRDSGAQEIYYRFGTPSGTTGWSWSAAHHVTGARLADSGNEAPAVVGHPDGTGWKAHAFFVYMGTAYYLRLAISSAGAIADDDFQRSAAAPSNSTANITAALHNTGDGKTPGSNPHVYLWALNANDGVLFWKITHSAGSWTVGTATILSAISGSAATNRSRFAGAFDGSRAVVAAWTSASVLKVLERDAADTTTTDRSPTWPGTADIGNVALAVDSDGNIYLAATDNGTTNTLRVNRYDRAAGAWDGWTTAAAAFRLDTVSLERRPSNGAVRVTGTEGSASPYTVAASSAFVVNQPPNAPTLTNPVGGAAIDRTVTNRFALTPNDPDPGDTSSALEIRYRPIGAATWTTTGQVVTTNHYYDFVAGTFAEGDHEWQARTWDAQGAVGPWAASEFFTAGTPPATPTITDPTSGQTIPSEFYSVTHSAPDQDRVERRRVADNAGSPDTATVYWSELQASSTSRSRSVAFPTNNRWEHVQVRIEHNGLWSEWASARVEVSYTPPASPSGSTATHTSGAAVDVSGTNPAPAGDEPTVTEMRLYVRSDKDPHRPSEGIRIAVDEPVNPTYTDWAVASGVAYEWRWQAIGDNGTSSYSAWFA